MILTSILSGIVMLCICTHALCWSNTLFRVIWKYRAPQLCTYSEGSKM